MLPQIDQEFKSLIPPLNADEYQQLEQNILSKRKCHEAILLWNDVIIDGHNRFEICMNHGIEFEIEEISFESREEAKIWIIENQMGRRNLNEAARIELALCKAELLKTKAHENLVSAGNKRAGQPLPKSTKLEAIDVREALSKEAGVGHSTLQRYMQVKKEADPQLLEKVKRGELKIGTAHRMLLPEIEKQLTQADKMYDYIKERLPFADETYNTQVCEKLNELETQLSTMVKNLERELECVKK